MDNFWSVIFDFQCINDARDILDTELSALVVESYSRAYGVMVSIQLLSELEEIILCLTAPDRKQQLQKTWWSRLLVSSSLSLSPSLPLPPFLPSPPPLCHQLYSFQGCQRNVEDWQKILQVRSLVLTQKVHTLSSGHIAVSICVECGQFVSLVSMWSNRLTGRDHLMGEVCLHLPKVGKDGSLWTNSPLSPRQRSWLQPITAHVRALPSGDLCLHEAPLAGGTEDAGIWLSLSVRADSPASPPHDGWGRRQH